MRIIYLTGEKINSTAINHILEICAHLWDLGHTVKIIAPFPSNNLKNEAKKFDIVSIPFFNRLRLKFFYLLAPFFLLKELLKENCDFFYTRFFPLEFFSALIAKSIFRLKYVLELNGPTEEELKIIGHNWWKIKLSTFAENLCYKMADGIIVPADGLKRYVDERCNFKRKIIVITNGVNTEIIIPLNKKECRLKLNLDLDKRYICFIGNFRKWQGIEIIIRTLKILLEKGLKVNLLLVGDGEGKKEYEKLCFDLGLNSSIIFTGRIDYKEIKYYLGASDICFFPFRYDERNKYGLTCLKLFDSMAAARPIITTNVGGLKKLVEDNGAGLVVNSNNPEEFAKVISLLLKNEDKMTLMGKRGRYLAENIFSWESIAKQTEEFLLSLK